MDPRLLQYYEDELTYLREGARGFGEEHEIAAQQLGLKTPNDPDPYVERLLEGVAFLGAMRTPDHLKDINGVVPGETLMLFTKLDAFY